MSVACWNCLHWVNYNFLAAEHFDIAHSLSLCDKGGQDTLLVIVDDSELFRLNVKVAIEEKLDIDVVELGTVRSMHEFFTPDSVRQVSLVILDLNLPDGNGLEALSQIIKSNRGVEIPVIIVSKGVNRAILPLAKKCGVGDIIAKPINPDELIRSIANFYPEVLMFYEKGNKPLEKHIGIMGNQIMKAQQGDYPLSLFIVEVTVEIGLVKDTAWKRGAMPSKSKQSNLKTLLKTSELELVLPITDRSCLVLMPFIGLKDAKAMSGFFKNVLKGTNLIIDDRDLVVASAVYPDQGTTAKDLLEILKDDYDEQRQLS